MKTYIALLRGINVGGKNIVAMLPLRKMFESVGYSNVKTYIQSGNIVFQAKNVDRASLSSEFAIEFGFKPNILIFELDYFKSAVNNSPYLAVEAKTSHFYFCERAPDLKFDLIEKYQTTSEQCLLADNVFYLHAPEGIGRSKLVANIEKCLGVPATGRNLNTVNKLLALAMPS